MRKGLKHVDGVVSLHEETAGHSTDTCRAVDSPGRGEGEGGKGKGGRGDWKWIWVWIVSDRKAGRAWVRRLQQRIDDEGPMEKRRIQDDAQRVS
jgi:hypothetical protein